MKYWLIIMFFTPSGEFAGQREIAYADEASCYSSMDYVRPPRKNLVTQMVCVSDDHFRGRRQDKNKAYD